MRDITEIPQDGRDLQIANSVVPKAANVLSIQLGYLEYAQDFGVDLRYFLQSNLRFQNASFLSYLVTRLTQHQINVVEVLATLKSLYEQFTFNVSDADNNSGGLIA
jgi:hypothetical protein